MNSVDKEYKSLLKRILVGGKEKGDRTGTGTLSLFSHNMSMDISEGFPLLTTKKMFTKGIITELLWFLSGDTNIKPLLEVGNKIWVGDAYKKYISVGDELPISELFNKSGKELVNDDSDYYRPFTKDEFINKILSDEYFANKWGELGPVYGKQWVNLGGYQTTSLSKEKNEDGYFEFSSVEHYGINQIQNIVELLKYNPDSRRMIVNAWNVEQLPDMTLPPCHWAFELYTEELTAEERWEWYSKHGNGDGEIKLISLIVNEYESDNKHIHDWLATWGKNVPTRRIHLKWHQRSVDSFLGLPFNIASYGLLLHMFAQQSNMVVGNLDCTLTNVHIYKNHIEQCKKQISREGYELPKLELNKAKNIFSYTYEDFKIKDYLSHPTIKGSISV